MYIRPTIEFSLPLYGNEQSKQLNNQIECVTRRSFKIITGLAKTTPNKILCWLSGFNVRIKSDSSYALVKIRL